MASEDKLHVKTNNRKRKHATLSLPSSTSTVNSQAPRGINVVEFAEARALELHNMVEGMAVSDRTGKKRLFQSLPKHMRRRAMSYNVKRMPVRLRGQAKREMETNKLEVKTSKKSRRQRRKAKELVEDYNRRQKQNIWLETHIWHAKRMKMVNAWGYRLAEHPSDKGFRAAHRAAANNCLLQDISYYGCIEITGNRKQILSAMSLLTRTQLGPTFGSVDCMTNGKEGHVVLYHKDCYPFGAIGPVSFLWRQTTRQSNGDEESHCESSQLWIWAHPACFDEVFQAIQESCKTVTTTTVVQKVDSLSTSSQQKTSCSIKQEKSINVSSLRFELVRFRLTGPLSHSLLVSMLELPDLDQEKCRMDDERSHFEKDEQNGTNSTEYEDGQVGTDEPLLSSQEFWERIKSASSSAVLPAHSVIGLTVVDPRLGMPGIRTSIDASFTIPKDRKDMPPSIRCPSNTAASSIWDATTRQRVKQTKISEQNLNQIRSKLLVPGSRLGLGDMTSHVPVLLVQQPGFNGFTAGWDIILPAGWAMAFWMGLVYRGARVGGLRDGRNCSLECEEPSFPRDVPDTRSGMLSNKEVQKEEENKYNRYPPAKRPNYSKFGFLSPFFIPWSQLVDEWGLEALKLTETLSQELQNLLPSGTQEIDGTMPSFSQGIDNAASVHRPEINNAALNRQEIHHVTPLDHRQPNKETSQAGEEMDIDINVDNKSTQEDSNSTFFVLRDSCQLRLLRRIITNVHPKTNRSRLSHESAITEQGPPLVEMMTRSLRAVVGVSLRMMNKGYPLPNATVSIPSVFDIESLQRDKTFGGPVEPLHKGSTQTVAAKDSLIGCCTRKVIGFVTSGQYSLSRGFGVGIAYCALPGLVELLTTRNQGIVLVRNTNTLQYRMALIEKVL